MTEHGKLYSFFFGKKIPIDRAKLDWKQLHIYEWTRICRSIANAFYFVLYNALFSLGWYSISQQFDGQVLDAVSSGTVATGYAVGHIGLNCIHWIVNKFSKEKTRKDMVEKGNPIPKTSATSVVFLCLSIIPATIYIIGRIVIYAKGKKYCREHGTFRTVEQLRQERLEEKKVDKKSTEDILDKIVKSVATARFSLDKENNTEE